jgi:serine/threonine-protein kinase RsbT
VLRESRVAIVSDVDIVTARHNGRALAVELGFNPTDSTLIATAISELARNIMFYAKQGEIILRPLNQSEPRGIVVVAHDNGPGILDVAQAMRVGYSTSGSLGLGLPGVSRLMDELQIDSRPGQGTTVTAKKWKR